MKLNNDKEVVNMEYKYEGKLAIGIKFSDNDFYSTIMNFMEKVIVGLDFTPTKEQVVEMFNSVAYGFYLAFQNKFEYHQDRKQHLEYLRDVYLKISDDDVFFGTEVADYLKSNDGWCNAEFFVCDNSFCYVC